MAQAEKGNTVTINFTGRLDDGTIFDTTVDPVECEEDECCSDNCEDDDCGCGGHASGPMTLVLGDDVLFPQIGDAIVGMSPGEQKTIKISAEDAFGEFDKEKIFSVPRSDLPEDIIPEVGDEMCLTNDDDEELEVEIIEVTEDQVTFNANHPLAGENLTYSVELISIN